MSYPQAGPRPTVGISDNDVYQRLPCRWRALHGRRRYLPGSGSLRPDVGAVHAIQMRTPIQLASDARPLGDWWNAVWHVLYERGLRVDVTPNRNGQRIR